MYTGFWWGNLRERDRLGDPGLDRSSWNVGGMDWIELAQDRDTYECGNEPSGSIKCGEFLD